MKRLMLIIFVGCLKFVYTFIKLLPTQANKITFISRESNSETLDIRMLRLRLEKMNKDVYVLCKKTDNLFTYFFHIFRQMCHIATSKVVVLDTYCIPISVLSHKHSLKVIQMWHSSAAIKKFGKQSINLSGGADKSVAEVLKMHDNYDFIIAPSRQTGVFFAEAFGYYIDSVRYYGLPRLQYLLEKCEETRIQSEKTRILYAPTFRENISKMRRKTPKEIEDIVNTQRENISQLANNIDFDKFQLTIKLHPLDRLTTRDISEIVVPISEEIIIDESTDTYDLIIQSDIIISDYSAIAIEASIVNKPVYLYQYDRDQYDKTTGLNITFDNEPIGKYVFKTAEDMIKSIENDEYDLSALADMREKYCSINVKSAADDLAFFIDSIAELD